MIKIKSKNKILLPQLYTKNLKIIGDRDMTHERKWLTLRKTKRIIPTIQGKMIMKNFINK